MAFKSLEELVLKLTNKTIGETVSYTPVSTSVAISVNAVFSTEQVITLQNQTMKPVIRIQLSDFAVTPVKGDLVTVRAINYKVENVQPDSYGGATLILKVA